MRPVMPQFHHSAPAIVIKNTFIEVVETLGHTTNKRSASLPASHRLERAARKLVEDCKTEGAASHGELTLMLRGLSRRYSQAALRAEIDSLGFDLYNFLYVPWDRKQGRSRGFAFINFETRAEAERFQLMMDEQRVLQHQTKPLQVVAADVQGLEALRSHFTADASHRKPLFLGPC